MADEMKEAFVRLGMSDAAAAAIVDEQGINSILELQLLTDTEIENLCKVVRRPGGTMPNPAATGHDTRNANQPDIIPNPGIPVSLRAENNLKLAAYWCRFRVKTSRTTEPADIQLDEIRKIRSLRDWELAHEDPKVPENLINNRDWTKTMDGIVEHLRNCLGSTGIPLAYVVRESIAITGDPTWPTFQDEMINRAPIMNAGTTIYNEIYLQDNQEVWNIISSLTREHPCWTYVKPAQKKRDGRAAFKALYDHYLGPNNVDTMATTAERALANASYHGEKKRWNFERFVSMQVDQHTILQGLTAHGYSGIDERSKVRYLLDGIKTKALDSVKAQILSSPILRTNFAQCVTLYKDFIDQQSPEDKQLNVSSTVSNYDNTTKKPNYTKGRNVKFSKDDEVQDRYYSKKEYHKLSQSAKLKLKRLREARGHTPNKRPRLNSDKGTKTNTDMSTRSVKAFIAALSKVSLDDNDTSESDQDNGRNDNNASNRNHPALTRQKRN